MVPGPVIRNRNGLPEREVTTGPCVLWVSPTVGTNFGGPTSTTVNGMIAEKRSGLDCRLVSTTSGDDDDLIGPAVDRLREEGIEVRLFRRTRLLAKAEAWGFSLSMALWMLRNLRRYDVVHLQYVWCMTSVWGAILARIFGTPVVVTPHESLTDYDIDVASRSRIKRRVKLALRQIYLRTVDRLIFMSQLEERDTRSEDLPFSLIPHAVQENPARTGPRESRLDEESLKIGFLGRNIPKKGIDLIIKAVARNPDRSWELSIAGPAGTTEFRRETDELIAGLEVGDRVKWSGFLPRRQDLFARCDVLVMPSAYEGFGMVSAEAMCHAVPVIVPRLSGVAEIVSEFDAGIVMPESSAEEVERALILIDDNPEMYTRFSKNSLDAANGRLTYEAYATATSALTAPWRAIDSAGTPSSWVFTVFA